MRKMPIILMSIMIVIAFVAGTLWFIGASTTERVLSDWFDMRRADGWRVEYSDLNTAGFPNRLDTTLTDLSISDPRTGVAWQAPKFQMLSLSYKPQHVIAVFLGEQVFETQSAQHRVEADVFQASVQVAPARDLTLQSLVLELAAATVASSENWNATVESAQVAMRQTPDRKGPVYDLDIRAENVTPDAQYLKRLGASDVLSDVIEQMHVSARVRFDKDWDRSALERARPQPRKIELHSLTANWGALELRMSGDLKVNKAGVVSGSLDVKAKRWREIVRIAQASGRLSETLASAVIRAGNMLAGLSGGTNSLDATVTFRGGTAFLGPLPIGDAPLIQLP